MGYGAACNGVGRRVRPTSVLTIAPIYAAFLVVGWLAGRKIKDGTPADFIVAGRAMPLWLATLTMTATWVDGGYLLGTAEGVYRSSSRPALQGGLCFGISLILGGLFFAQADARARLHHAHRSLRGALRPRWAAVLSLPAMLARVFWSAELLVALGSTFGVILGIDLTTAILISAAVVTLYTMSAACGRWPTPTPLQLALVAIGLALRCPSRWTRSAAWSTRGASIATARPEAARSCRR